MILWKPANAEPIAARVAVGGDYLPAGRLALPSGGWRDAAAGLAPHFDDVAVSFVNLESSLDSHALPVRPLAGLGDIVSAPAAALDYLQAIRCEFVGIANNHSFDFRIAGVERTCAAVAQRCMIPLGEVGTIRSAPDVAVWRGPGSICVGFWAAAIASRDLATRTAAGVEPATINRATEAVEALRSRGAHASIALLHAGCLRTNRPDPADVDLIDAIAASGFDIVAASHSHRISGGRILAGRNSTPSFCFYGLGSLASGFVASPPEREGLVVVAGFTPRGNLGCVEVRPVHLAESGFGEVPTPRKSEAILTRFRALSAEVTDGASSSLFYKDVSDGLARLYLRDARAAFRQSGLRGLGRKAARLRLGHIKKLVRSVIP